MVRERGPFQGAHGSGHCELPVPGGNRSKHQEGRRPLPFEWAQVGTPFHRYTVLESDPFS
jgi:hypothetical protein